MFAGNGKVVDLKSLAKIEEAYDTNVRFKTGDHVFKKGPLKSYVQGDGAFHEPIYGQVVHHSNASAKVRWADGTETTHNHNGNIRGNNNPYSNSYRDSPGKIYHPTVYDPSGHSRVASPEEHKAYSDKFYNDAVSRSRHKDDVAVLRTKFLNLQPHQLTHEHVQKMKDLMGEIEKHNNG